MSRVEIPVEAKLNAGDIEGELKQLTAKINALGASIAKANQVKFNPITKASLDDVKRMNAEFEKLKRTSQLAQDLNRTGQSNKSFLDIDWSSISTNAVAREARRYGAFTKVLGGTGASFSQVAPAPAPGGGGGSGGSGGGGSGGGSGGSGGGGGGRNGGGSPWASAGRNVASSALRGAGGAGVAADEALSAGLAGGLGAGIIGLVGGLVSKGISAVTAKIGDAQQDDIGYDTLKRTLGDVNVSFGVLKSSIHAASDAFDVTYQQAQKMASDFAHISGISGKSASESIAQEIAVGGGFGRAFGVDPEQSNSFFAQMRQFGVTKDTNGSNRLAVEISEAITKSGAFSKTDEVLQAIGAYTSQQTRMGLAPANVGGYSAMLTSMVGAHVPGMDVMGSAGLLNRVNSSIASGGNAGEAGQNFLYTSIGRKLGLDPIMAAALREQGAFGTGQQEFGAGSVMGQWASRHGVNIAGGAASSTTTNLEMVKQQLKSVYGDGAGRAGLRLNAMSNLFGINTNQAAFLDDMSPNQMGQVSERLKKAGIDPSKMQPTGYAMAAQVAVGNSDDVKSVASQLWEKMSPGERDSLNKAHASGDDDYRNELLKDVNKYGQGDTEGSKTRETIQGVDKTLQDFASKAVPALNVMRDAMLYAFGDHGKMSPEDLHKAVYNARKDDIDKKYNDAVSKSQSEHMYGTVGGSFNKKDVDPEVAARNRAAIAADTANAGLQRGVDMAKLNDEMYPGASTSPGSTAALPDYLQSGGSGSPGSGGAFDPITGGAPRSGDPRNMRNNNPGNLKYNSLKDALANGATGVDKDGFAVFPTAQVGTAAMDHQLSLYGSRDHLNTVAGVISKWAPSSDHNDTAQYIKDVCRELGVGPNDPINMNDPKVRQALGRAITHKEGGKSSMSAFQPGTPMPNTGSTPSYGMGAGGTQQYSFDHSITLYHPNGQQAAAPTWINTTVSAPTPYGN